MKSRNMEEDMAEDRHLWRLGVDGRLLAVQILNQIRYFSIKQLLWKCRNRTCDFLVSSRKTDHTANDVDYLAKNKYTQTKVDKPCECGLVDFLSFFIFFVIGVSASFYQGLCCFILFSDLLEIFFRQVYVVLYCPFGFVPFSCINRLHKINPT